MTFSTSIVSKMKSAISLDDLSLFLAVTDAGGLQGAAAATGVSAPTLSRRMVELERRTGRRLFERGRHGYALTVDGRALLVEAAPLRPLSARLAAFGQTAGSVARIRVTAGVWTARFLARHIRQVWKRGDPWLPEFLSVNASLDIARREADIGVRARRPDQSWLAAKLTSRIDYAVYGRPDAPDGFIALTEGLASTPAERWLRATHPDRIVTSVNTERLALDLARAGMGRMVMPIFAGADDSGLVRLSDTLHEIEHEEWLVSHHEARHDPPVRRALIALERLLSGPRPT
jgi:DNA-binding transcriptional LysR family regulator